jgi:hypothetical protein
MLLRLPIFWRAVLIVVACAALLLLALFGSGLTGSVCREAQIVSPFHGPFSTVCRQIFLRDLFLKNSAGDAI